MVHELRILFHRREETTTTRLTPTTGGVTPETPFPFAFSEDDYEILAGIARARGDESAAARWESKRDALLAELERRAG